MASSRPVRVAVHGAGGRMGCRILQLLQADEDAVAVAAIERPKHPRLGEDAGALAGLPALGFTLAPRLEPGPDVVIDLSSPEATLSLAARCAELGIPLVVGTTGFEPSQRAELTAHGERIPLIVASNFSRAVNLLMHLVEEAARALRSDVDIEIVERHHRFKKDAPSGTALSLANAAARGVGLTSDAFVHGRHGLTGERPRTQIGLHALRTGDNPGEHTVVFGLMGECLELSHRALNRDGFVRGAIEAAKWLPGKPAGLYGMEDVLGFRS